MSANDHTDNMSMMTTVNGTVNKIQNHLIILFLVLSVIFVSVFVFVLSNFNEQDHKSSNKIWKIARFVPYFAHSFAKVAGDR